MSRTGIMGLTIVVLAGLCSLLAYRLWIDCNWNGAAAVSVAPEENTRYTAAPLPEPSSQLQTFAAMESSAAAASIASEKNRWKSSEQTAFIMNARDVREGLDHLPYWLKVPETKRDELAAMLSSQSVRGEGTGDDPNAQSTTEELQQQDEQKIAHLLGYELYQRWKEYQETLPARHQLEAMNARLNLEETLPEDQIRMVASIMTQVQQTTAPECQARLRSELESVASGDPANVRKTFEASGKEWRLNDELTSNAVRPYLSDRQRKAFDELQVQRRRMREASAKVYENAAESIEHARSRARR